MTRIGILTGGGDAPGLNAAIRAIVRTAMNQGDEVIAIRKGWKGLLTNEMEPFSFPWIDELVSRGGTMLGSSRTNPYKEPDGVATIKKNLATRKIDALIAMGGEDTIGVATKLFKDGVSVIGIPKTIDNDLNAADFTIGFATALDIATQAIDRLKTTAESHGRVMIVEIMGRHAGWLATYAGIAGGADAILVPEFPMRLSEVCDVLEKCKKRGKNYAIIAVAEGAEIIGDDGKKLSSQSAEAVDSFGHVQLGGIGELLAAVLKKKTGADTRATVLGHTQRGGSPSAFDRILGTLLGLKAMELVRTKQFGKMPTILNGKLQVVALSDATDKLKTVSPELYQLAKELFG